MRSEFKRWSIKSLEIAHSFVTDTVVQRILDAVGLLNPLSKAYHETRRRLMTTATITVSNIESKFYISTYQEYLRFVQRDLMDERPIIEDLLATVTGDDVVFDIGANVGAYTCFTAEAAKHTVAFEPEPTNAERLRKNLSYNNRKATVLELALADENGYAKLTTATTATGEGKHYLSDSVEKQGIEVKTICGDTLVNDREIPQPSIVKIDVEGTEHCVLRGLTDTISKPDCHTIYVEVHDPTKLIDIRSFLNDSGFNCTELDIDRNETFLKATR
jgi:FkbM family methyltransferase